MELYVSIVALALSFAFNIIQLVSARKERFTKRVKDLEEENTLLRKKVNDRIEYVNDKKVQSKEAAWFLLDGHKYCSVCWAKDKTEMHINVDYRGHYNCPNCNNNGFLTIQDERKANEPVFDEGIEAFINYGQ